MKAGPRAPVCFTWAEAARLRDSLEALPAARREARAWHAAAGSFEAAAVAAVRADSARQQQVVDLRLGAGQQHRLLVDMRGQRDMYRARAHRKGWLLAGLLTIVAFLLTK